MGKVLHHPKAMFFGRLVKSTQGPLVVVKYMLGVSLVPVKQSKYLSVWIQKSYAKGFVAED